MGGVWPYLEGLYSLTAGSEVRFRERSRPIVLRVSSSGFDPYRKCGGSLLTALFCRHNRIGRASPLPQSALDPNQRGVDQNDFHQADARNL